MKIVKLTISISLLILFAFTSLSCDNRGMPSYSDSTAGAFLELPANSTANLDLKQKDKISFFYVTAGVSVPKEFDFKDNIFLNTLADMANVEISEAKVPPWTDIASGFNLMMASNEICDVVHYSGPGALIRYGKLGSFIDLSEYLHNSKILTKRYLPYIEQLKTDDGKIYCLRALPSDGDVNEAFGVRYDLLLELGYERIPETMDEWLNAMRKLKQKYPDSIPYTSRENLHSCEFVFKSYGCAGSGYGWQYYNGKVIHTFENPLYKEAIKVYRIMLEEGLMDVEFATNKQKDFSQKRINNKVLINQQNLSAIAGWIGGFAFHNIDEAIFIPAQWPKIDDPRIDPQSVYEGMLSLGEHSISISSMCNKDAAARFVEILISDECMELTSWGREGIEYNIVDGEKVINYEESAANDWRQIYGILFGNSKECLKLELNLSIAGTKLDDVGKKEYARLYWEQFDKVFADANSVPMNPMKVLGVLVDHDILAMRTQAEKEARTIAVKAMLGEVSLDEFDILAESFINKYQFITEEYNDKLPQAK